MHKAWIRFARAVLGWHLGYSMALYGAVLGLGVGAIFGHPEAGALIGGLAGGLLGMVAGRRISRIIEEQANAPPPAGGWRRWEDDDDWD